MTSSLTKDYALVGEAKPSQKAHQLPRYSTAPEPQAAVQAPKAPAVIAPAVLVEAALSAD